MVIILQRVFRPMQRVSLAGRTAWLSPKAPSAQVGRRFVLIPEGVSHRTGFARNPDFWPRCHPRQADVLHAEARSTPSWRGADARPRPPERNWGGRKPEVTEYPLYWAGWSLGGTLPPEQPAHP